LQGLHSLARFEKSEIAATVTLKSRNDKYKNSGD
jgi:hypothetical protein